ncbi:DNA pilot protein [Blackfly microvirus SF02]|uniref:DNA pilot protein n=1 Tax=Blackfly microvirus SF02 TaxID=2576452 RepID=A0A4P8PKH7_9VIRU|nr:DNA pilot protein [Blackfly microvirus SF02]
MGMFDFLSNPMSSLLGSVVGAGASMFNQDKTNEMQQQMMQQQNSFQERMSSTAYQRASTDMQAAGLNPMMMFGGGSAASSPTGAAPSASVKAPGSGIDSSTFERALSSATQQRVADKTIDNLVDQNAKIKAETLTEDARFLSESQRSRLLKGQTANVAADTDKTRAVIPVIANQAITAKNESDISPGVRKLLDQSGYGGRKVEEVLSPVGDMVSSAKGVRSMMPTRSRTERHYQDGRSSTFEERWSSH